MYNTLLNLQSGPRLFEQSILVRPMPNTKPLFDNLYEESFGWGGDPSNALRLRASKRRLYDFRFSFRRDENYFDYNLFANPLNPTSTSPALPTILVNTSPHLFNNKRRMYEYNLLLLPQQRLSFNIEYYRNRNEGPSFSSVHQGTEALLSQAYNTTVDNIRFGASWRINPRTTFNYTQSFQWFKNDTNQFLTPSITFSTATGVPVEFGLPWLGGSPCAAPLIAGSANPICSGYLSYTRTQRFRNFLPTEQVTLTSRSIKHVDFTGRYSYSSADTNTPLSETFDGLVSRSAVRQSNTNGSAAHSTWITNQGDSGVTVHLGSHLRIVDTFRYYSYSIPGQLYLFQNNFFNQASVAAPNITLPIAVPPVGAFHNASSPADVQNEFYHRFVQQRTYNNQFTLQYDVSRHFGVHVGYLYRNIYDNHNWISTAINDLYYADPTGVSTATCTGAGGTINADGSCSLTGEFDSETEAVTINQHWALAGFWYRMGEKFRLDADARIMSADNFLTRIDPRKEQQYRANASYNPRGWLTVGANVNLREQRNRTQDFGYNGHVRNFGITATGAPQKRLSVDLAYNYTNSSQNANICYVGTVVAAPSFACTNDNSLRETLGFYSNRTHYGSANVMLKPTERVQVIAGYSIIDTDGNTLFLNALQTLGPLSFRYHQPLAAFAIGVTKQVQLRAGWNYYQYNENSLPGPTLPRYFHANLVTLSARYAF